MHEEADIENAAETPDETKMPCKGLFRFDIFLICFVLVCDIISFDPAGIFHYCAARFSLYHFYRFFLYMMAIYLALPFLCIRIYLLIRILFKWHKHIADKTKLRLTQVSLILILPVLVVSISSSNTYVQFTDGFIGYVQETDIDLQSARTWLLSLDKNLFSEEWQNIGYVRKTVNNFPETFTNINPTGMVLSIDKENHRTVRFTWATHGWLWGIVIGPETMETPETDLGSDSADGTRHFFGEYRVEIQKGVYAWYRL